MRAIRWCVGLMVLGAQARLAWAQVGHGQGDDDGCFPTDHSQLRDWLGPNWDGTLQRPHGYPSVWEGGTNLGDPGAGGSKLDEPVISPCGKRRTPSDLVLLSDGLQVGRLALRHDADGAPIEVWTWRADNAWPDTFELRAAPAAPMGAETASWTFPNLPFELDQPDRWLDEVAPAPQDRLYEVSRVDATGEEVVAWFWFQADATWTQVAYAVTDLQAERLRLAPGEILRFEAVSEVEDWQDLPVLRAGD